MGGIVFHPQTGWYYVPMYNRMDKGLQKNGTCVMRTRSLLDPRSWRAWDGTEFTVPFVSAYALPPGEEAKHICTVLDSTVFPEPCVMYGVTWSTFLNRFVATINCNTMARHIHLYDYKIWVTTSTDMIHWDPLTLLLDPQGPPEVPQYGGADMITYPTLLDVDSPSKGDFSYNQIGQQATLTYIVNSENFWIWGRQLMGYNVSFSK